MFELAGGADMLRPISAFSLVLTRLVSSKVQTYRWEPHDVVD